MATRRPSRPQDGRSRILDAARAAFGDRGYNATTIRAIALRAEISEPMVFRYFGTKENLFEQAVLGPFTDFISHKVEEWKQRAPGSRPPLEETTRIYDDLVDLFLAERPVMVALLAVYHYDDATPAVTRKLEAAMRSVIALLEQRASAEVAVRGNPSVDIPILVRAMLGIVFSLVTLPRLFATTRVDRRRLTTELAMMTLYGTRFRHAYTRDDFIAGAGLGLDDEKLEPHLGAPRPQGNSSQHSAAVGFGPVLSDELWRRLEPEIATEQLPRRGPRSTDDRLVLEGVLQVLVNGRSWNQVTHRDFGVSGTTCWRRLRTWQDLGVWHRVLEVLAAAGIPMDGKTI